MKFEEPAALIRSLLRRSDRHPVRAIGAEELGRHDPRFVRRLKALGVLVEREDQRDDGDAVLQVDGGALIEIETETGACARAADACDIQLCDIELGAICRELREQSGLTGPGPARLSSRAWRLGRHVRRDRAAEVCLVRLLRADTAQEIVDHLRGTVDAETPVALIALSRFDPPTPIARQLDALRMTITAADDHLGSDPAFPFALDMSRLRLPTSSPANVARLLIDRIGRRVVFDDIELNIEPRDHDVLVLLAEEAAADSGWVSRDAISSTLQAATGRESNPEQADRSINRLRDVFRRNDRLRDVPRDGFIETRSKVGYRLTLARGDIGFLS